MHGDEELIWKFLDGDLTRSEAELIEEHLDLDDRFRRQMADIRDLDRLLEARTAELPSLSFATSVMEKIQSPMPTTFDASILSRKFTAWYLAIVSVLLIMTLGLGANMFNSSLQPTDTSLQLSVAVVEIITHPAFTIFFQISIGLGFIFLLDAYLANRQKRHQISW